MKINDINKYHQKIELKEKINLINKFNTIIESKLVDKFNLLKIDYPIAFNENSIFVSKAKNERILTFDSFNRDKLFYYYTDLSIWLKNKLTELNINNNEGLLVFNKKINRDNNVYESLTSNYLTIELRINEQDKNEEKFYEDLFFKILKIIRSSFEEVLDKKTLSDCQIFNKNRIKIANFKEVNKKFLSKKDILENYIPKYESVLMNEASLSYIDNHNIFNPFREEDTTTIKFYYLNKINKDICTICSIYTRPDYDTLVKQCELSNFDVSKIEQYKDIYSKRSVCFELNLSNLYSCVFKEFSNCESTNSCESEELYNMYKKKNIKVM